MQNKLTTRFKRAFNAFFNKDPTKLWGNYYGPMSSKRPDKSYSSTGYVSTMLTPVINRISMDAASIDILHVKLDDNHRFADTIDDELNQCFTTEANIDQTGRAFRQDLFFSLCDEGNIAVIPVDTDVDPDDGSFKVLSLRIGKVVEWMPQHVRLRAYNENTGRQQELIMSKKAVALIENPFYSIMNGSNSIGQRLMQKLHLLDVVDEQLSSGKLDLIIQLPYSLRSEFRQNQADERLAKIEDQLTGNKYGIAYIDSTEHITQLNRPLENNLLAQIEYLYNLFLTQLGVTAEILNGTADEKVMLNYYNRLIEPIVASAVDEFKRKFLSKTARTQLQSIMYFRDPFKLVPAMQLADIADRLTRNEIASSNELRAVIGWKPSKQKGADELRNKNIAAPTGTGTEIQNGGDNDALVDEVLNSLEGQIDEIIGQYENGDEKNEEE